MACVARVRLRNSSAWLHGEVMLVGDSALSALQLSQGKAAGLGEEFGREGGQSRPQSLCLRMEPFWVPTRFPLPCQQSACTGEITRRKKSVCCRRREGRSRKGASPLSPLSDVRSSAPASQYFPPLVIAGLDPPMVELPVDSRAVLAFPVQLGHLTHASSQPQTSLRCSSKEPNGAGFSGHFLTTSYPFCSSLQAKQYICPLFSALACSVIL